MADIRAGRAARVSSSIGRAANRLHPARIPIRSLALAQLRWPVVSLAVAMMGASLVLMVLNGGELPLVWMVGPLLAAVVSTLAGAVVIGRKAPGAQAQGWTWAAIGMTVSLLLLTQEYALHGLVVAPGSLPGAELAAWLEPASYCVLLFLVVLSLLLFPTGTLPSRPWLVVLLAAFIIQLLAAEGKLAAPHPFMLLVRPPNQPLPGTVPPGLRTVATRVIPWSQPVVIWGQPLMVGAAGASILSRVRVVAREQRLELKWTGYLALIAAAGLLIQSIGHLPLPGLGQAVVPNLEVWGKVVWLFGISTTPLAHGLAVLRLRLYGVDRVISGGLLVGAMAAFVTMVYAIAVAGASSAAGSRFGLPAALLASICVAIAFSPVRQHLQSMIDRLVYGRRSPYEVLIDFGRQVALSLPSDEVLPAVARLLAEVSDASRVEIWVRVDATVRQAAAWPAQPDRRPALPLPPHGLPEELRAPGSELFPVYHQGQMIGAVAVIRPWGTALASPDGRLLVELTRQLGLILHNVRLVEELRSSRQRIVSAQDAERRRLEQNLHDGAQSQLAMAALLVGECRALAEGDPLLKEKLDKVADRLSTGLADLRQLAHGLNPFVLTKSGLEGAIEFLADRSAVPVTLDLALPDQCSFEANTTAYYFVSEAIANVAKHALASSITIRGGESEGGLWIEVGDDGQGGADPARGLGLTLLGDRIEAIGGQLAIVSPKGEGTRLRLWVPCG